MALDGIVRMVDAFFRHWDDTEKMWSEYERAGFRLIVIGGELHLSELRPVERMKYRCKHRRLVERWRDMRLEGSKLGGWRTPARSMKAASLACSRRWSRVLILDVREICPCLANAPQPRCERTSHRHRCSESGWNASDSCSVTSTMAHTMGGLGNPHNESGDCSRAPLAKDMN